MHVCETNAMEHKSEYFSNVLTTSCNRYESKVTPSGLLTDPYQWYEYLENFPKVHALARGDNDSIFDCFTSESICKVKIKHV